VDQLEPPLVVPDLSFKVADPSDEGYTRSLSRRQMQMLAMGGAIGVGLFLGAGGRLHSSGPALMLAYAAAGIIAFLLMRALGELVMYRPTSGSFVSYAREFFGPRTAYVSGWMYMLNWGMTGIAELSAVAVYVAYWWPALPHWVAALVALAIVASINLVSVRVFGEFEFWASVLKVTALCVFLAVGLGLVLTGTHLGKDRAGPAQLFDHGGFIPQGVWPVVLVLNGVIFAYSAIEIIGIAAGESDDPQRVIPRAIKAIVLRISIFYVGSVLLLAMLLPYTAFSSTESPFVTVFARLGVPGIGGVMNFVVLTAAMSSCNSGLYSIGRIMRTLAMEGDAPSFAARMSKQNVPYGGILMTAAFYLLGVLLNFAFPGQAFEIALNMASVGILWTWGTIFACQLRFRAAAKRGEVPEPTFRMPGSPYTSWIGLIFLALVFVLIGFDHPVGTWTVALTPVVGVLLWVGWLVARRRSASLGG